MRRFAGQFRRSKIGEGGEHSNPQVEEDSHSQLESTRPSSTSTSRRAGSAAPAVNGRQNSQPIIPSSGENVTRKDYWQIAVEEVQRTDPKMKDHLKAVKEAAEQSGTTNFADQLFHVTQQRQKELEERKLKLETRMGEFNPHKSLNQLAKVAISLRDVVLAAGNHDPLQLGIPLAACCVLMQMTLNESAQYAAMVAGVKEVATIVLVWAEKEEICRPSPDNSLKRHFEQRLVSLYKNIIYYQISAISYYQRKTIVRFLRTFYKADDPWDKLVSIRADEEACQKIYATFDSSSAYRRDEKLQQRFDRLDERFDRLWKSQSEQADPDNTSQRSSNVHWMVSRKGNPSFTGREDILTQLETTVRDVVCNPSPSSQCCIVISGMGGQGKSEICLQLANRVRELFWGVFWMDVSHATVVENRFLSIASRLGIKAKTWEEAKEGLANVKESWLLVLDNADDLQTDYQHYFPAGLSSVVVLTSRNAQCGTYAECGVSPNERHVALEGLPANEARELLLKSSGLPLDQYQTIRNDADAIVSLLSSHPLALIQAGAYVSRGHCTLAEYPEVFKMKRERLLRFRPRQAKSRYGDAYATFEASADALQEMQTTEGQDALDLLSILANYAANGMPLLLFQTAWEKAHSVSIISGGDENGVSDRAFELSSWHVHCLPAFLQVNKDEWESIRLIEAIDLLKAFSLVSIDNPGVPIDRLIVSMHPLAHAWARDRQDQYQQQQSWLTAGCLAAFGIEHFSSAYEDTTRLKRHIYAVTSWEKSEMFKAGPDEKVTGVLLECGNWYDQYEPYMMREFVQDLFDHLGLEPSKVDSYWLPLYSLAARCAQAGTSIPLLEQVLQIKTQEQKFSDHHPDILSLQRDLAGLYSLVHQEEKAVHLMEKAVKNAEIYPENDENRLSLQASLAQTFIDNYQAREAISLLGKVIEIEEKYFNIRDSKLRREVAGLLRRVSYQETEESMSLLERAVKIEEEYYPEDDLDLYSLQERRAIIFIENNQFPKAITLLQKIIQDGEKFSADDEWRLSSQELLVEAFLKDNQVEKAISWLEKAIEDLENLDVGNKARLTAQDLLAAVFLWNNQIENAISCLEKLIKDTENLTEQHPCLPKAQFISAIAYWKVGEHSKGLEMMTCVVEAHIKGYMVDPALEAAEKWLKFMENRNEQIEAVEAMVENRNKAKNTVEVAGKNHREAVQAVKAVNSAIENPIQPAKTTETAKRNLRRAANAVESAIKHRKKGRDRLAVAAENLEEAAITNQKKAEEEVETAMEKRREAESKVEAAIKNLKQEADAVEAAAENCGKIFYAAVHAKCKLERARHTTEEAMEKLEDAAKAAMEKLEEAEQAVEAAIANPHHQTVDAGTKRTTQVEAWLTGTGELPRWMMGIRGNRVTRFFPSETLFWR